MSESPTRGPDTTGGQEVVLLLATQVGVVLAGLATQSLTAYILLPEGRGAYAVCLMLGFLFGVLFTPGADRGAQYFVMSGRTSVSQGVSIASAICIVGAGLGAAAAIPLIHSDIAFFQKADTRSFYFALSLVPLTAYSTSLHLQLAGLRRFAKLALFSLLQSMTNVVMISTLVWGLDLGVNGAVVSVALGHAVFIGACISDLRRSCGLVPELPRRADVARVLGYGWKGYVARTGAVLDQRVGILFLGMLASRADIGIFAVGIALMTRFTMIPNSVVPSIMPRIASDAQGRPDLVTLSTRGVYWATGAALMGLLAISSPLVRVLLSEAFLPVVPILWVLAPGVLAFSGSLVITAYFNSVNRPHVCSWATGVGLSANVGSLVILYPVLGFEAAAWAMTIGFVSRSVFLLFMYRRTTGASLSSLFLPQREDPTRLWRVAQGVLGRSAGSNQVKVADGLLIKRQPPERSRLERSRSRFGARVADECGLFEVPEIISYDDDSGETTFRFVEDSVTLGALLIDRTEYALMERAGRALAAIHEAGANATGSEVSWHGDYGLENILYSETRDCLTIIDWSNARWAFEPADRARGNPGLDLGVALISLFDHRVFGTTRIPKPEALSAALLEGYIHGRAPFSREAVHQYITRLLRCRHRYWKTRHGALRAMAHYPSLSRLRLFLSNIGPRLEQK